MIETAVRIREIVASNVDTMLEKASDPRKMLGRLCTEIEESLIALHAQLAQTRRHAERCEASAASVAEKAEEWTGKAKIAMDHKREDLARSALLAREDERNKAKELSHQAQEAQAEAERLEKVVAALETKRKEVSGHLEGAGGAPTHCPLESSGDERTDRRLDRIAQLERRIDYASKDRAEPAPVSVDEEIASLQRDAEISAELTAMKSPHEEGRASKKAGAKKRNAK